MKRSPSHPAFSDHPFMLRLLACILLAEMITGIVSLFLLTFFDPLSAAVVRALLLAAVLAPPLLVLVLRPAARRFAASAKRADSALQAAANGIVIVDVDGTILWVNPAFCTLTGYRAEELVGRHTRLLKSGCHDDAFYKELWTTVTSGRVWNGVIVNRKKDGTLYTEEQTITPVFGETGAISHFVSINQDISGRIAVDKALRDAHRLFNAFMDNNPTVAFMKDEEGRYLYVNRTFESTFDTTCAQLLGKTDFDIWPRGIAKQFREHDLEIMREGKPRQFSEKTEATDGRVRRWLVLKFPVSHAGDRVALGGVAVDVTELHLAQEALSSSEQQLRQAQKLEAVGRLAAGVAHDFNNLLTAIMGYNQLIRLHLPLEPSVQNDAAAIQRAVERATALTRQLLAFSRKQAMEPRVVDLNEIVRSTKTMLDRLIGEEIAITLSLCEGLWPVKVDPGQMEQVILNLALNARDAMPGGGRLTIESSNLDRTASAAADHPGIQRGEHAVLAVTDTGCGMDRDTLSRIFEPFFTTKGPEKGTGLGLSVVHGIVLQNNGYIDVSSEPARGSTFRIYFPRTEEATAALPVAGPSRPRPRGTESVLIVEDEEGARTVVVETLRRHGYFVAEASSGEDALKALGNGQERPVLALIDLILPGMSGRALAERLRHVDPDMRILYMSGYDENAIPSGAVPRDGAPRLQKPFTADLLLGKIREVLDRPAIPASSSASVSAAGPS